MRRKVSFQISTLNNYSWISSINDNFCMSNDKPGSIFKNEKKIRRFSRFWFKCRWILRQCGVWSRVERLSMTSWHHECLILSALFSRSPPKNTPGPMVITYRLWWTHVTHVRLQFQPYLKHFCVIFATMIKIMYFSGFFSQSCHRISRVRHWEDRWTRRPTQTERISTRKLTKSLERIGGLRTNSYSHVLYFYVS